MFVVSAGCEKAPTAVQHVEHEDSLGAARQPEQEARHGVPPQIIFSTQKNHLLRDNRCYSRGYYTRLRRKVKRGFRLCSTKPM